MEFSYELIRTRRKTISLQITSKATLVVRAPRSVDESYISKLIDRKRNWIEKKFSQIEKRHDTPKLSSGQIQDYRRKARIMLKARLDHWAEIMQLEYKSFRLSSAKTRWGSCSGLNVISLNWKLILTEGDLVDYVAIHELAHITHKNHSANFWSLVSKFDPVWREHRKQLGNFTAVLEL